MEFLLFIGKRKAIEESGKPLRKIGKPLKKAESC
jgi:hypothetical protein